MNILTLYYIFYVFLAMYMLDSDQEPSYNLSKHLLLLPRILKLIEDMVNDSIPLIIKKSLVFSDSSYTWVSSDITSKIVSAVVIVVKVGCFIFCKNWIICILNGITHYNPFSCTILFLISL